MAVPEITACSRRSPHARRSIRSTYSTDDRSSTELHGDRDFGWLL
jgi:hypothetical protein